MWGFTACFGVKKIWPFRRYQVPLRSSGSVNHALWRNIPKDQNLQRRADVEDTAEVGENDSQ